MMRTFYSFLLWATRLEIALAKDAPIRNCERITNLQRDEFDYERALTRLELGL